MTMPPEQPYTPPEQQPADKPKRAVSVGQILAGILLVIVVVFVVENTNKVSVRLIFPKVQVPLAVALLIAAVLGALISALLRYRRKRHHQNKT